VGAAEALGGMIKDGATAAWEGAGNAYDWASKGENWSNAADGAWDWASDGQNWADAGSATVQSVKDAGSWVAQNPRKIGTTVGEFIPDAVAAAYTAGGSLALTGTKVAGKEVLEEAGERAVREALEEGAEKAGKEALEAGAKRSTAEVLEQLAKKEGADLAKVTDGSVDDIAEQVVKKPSKPKLKAGTLEHKAARWEAYQKRGGKWDYDRWSKQYDTNMKNAQHGLAREQAYRDQLGGKSETVKTPHTNRQIDISKPDEMYAGQLKTGKMSLNKQAKIDIAKDAAMVKQGYQVEYILEKGASQPFLDALKANGIDYHIGPKIP